MTAVIQRSFAGGELTPSLHARVDQLRYQTGLKTLRNFFVLDTGGAASRPGMKLVHETRTPATGVTESVLIPFVFNNEQAYVLEFASDATGKRHMRVIEAGDYVRLAAPAAYNAGTAYTAGQNVSYGGLNYSAIRDTTGDQPDISPNDWHPMTADIYEIYQPFDAADLADVYYSQSADVVVLVHNSYPIAELHRLGLTAWTITFPVEGASIATPASVAATVGNVSIGAVDGAYFYAVTAVDAVTGEESLLGGAAQLVNAHPPDVAHPNGVTWAAVAAAGEYWVYRYTTSGVYGFIGLATGLSFSDPGIEPDSADRALQVNRDPFANSNYPGIVTHSKQRRVYARMVNGPETVEASELALYRNFNKHVPIQDTDALNFTIAGPQVNLITHLIELRRMIIMTETAEWVANGSTDGGVLTPDQISLEKHTEYGSSKVRPVIVGESAVFVQARGSIMRDLTFDIYSDGYKGNNLSIFSKHLFSGHTIICMAYAQTPNSIIWVVRDDGVLLSFTYVIEHQIWAWAHHDTDGLVKRVCVIPEGDEDAVYMVVERVINGATRRFIERFASRYVTEATIEDYIGMDAAVVSDNWNLGATTMTLPASTGYTAGVTRTLAASVGTFVVGDVGKTFILQGLDGSLVRFLCNAYTSNVLISGTTDVDVPASLQNVATLNWARMVTSVSGLGHLEGKEVSVLADGSVMASPNNADYASIVVTAGVITLPNPAATINIGLPFLPDLETLDIDTVNGETMVDKKKLITGATVYLESTRGGFIGPTQPVGTDPLAGLFEMKYAKADGEYIEALELFTGFNDEQVESNWNKGAHLFIRQVDPLPMTIGAIVPRGMIPFRGAA